MPMVPAFSALPIGTSIVLVISLAIFARLLHILPGLNARPPVRSRASATSYICIVLGSGGHTTEMFSMLRDLDPCRYTQRTYIISSGDDFSANKAFEFERKLAEKKGLKLYQDGSALGRLDAADSLEISSDEKTTKKASKALRTAQKDVPQGGYFEIITVPRARKIHQPLWSTPLSSLYCFRACIQALLPHLPSSSGSRSAPETATQAPRNSPDLVLTNGPATGVIVVLASLALRFLGSNIISRSADAEDLTGNEGELRTVYVESWARVKALSLSGKILQMGLVDRFLVQWEGLKSGRAEYKGALVD